MEWMVNELYSNLSIFILSIYIEWAFICNILVYIFAYIEDGKRALDGLDLGDLIGIFFLAPFVIFLGIHEFFKEKEKKIQKKRETCSWWELKEYGGKY